MTRRERFTDDERGVSEVVGAILVFGLLIALMAILQTQAVPAANAEVEFDHNQEVQGDLAKFHERASRVALYGSGESVRIRTGTGYPTRMLFFNPPRAAGTVSTSENREATISNAEATDPEVADYLDGSDVTLDSRTFRYSVRYNELDEAPTTKYEYGILYNQHRDATINQNPGSVIDDTHINLVFMAGDYSRTTSQAQSLDVRPVSAPARPVTVEGENGNDIVLELPTEMPVSEWQDLYGDQDTVVEITEGSRDDTVEITLDGSEQYTLRMAALGLEQGVEKPDAHYIVPANDGVADVGTGGETSVVFEVRDRYNNPVAGEEVEIDFDGTTHTVKTNEEGRAVISVPASSTGTAVGEIVDCNRGTPCYAEFDVNVLNPGGMINPSSGVRFSQAVLVEDSDLGVGDFVRGIQGEGARGESAALYFDADPGLTFESIRVNYYSRGGDDQPPEYWTMDDGNSQVSGEISGTFESGTIDPDPSQGYVEIAFPTGPNSNELEYVSTGDYFVISVQLSNGHQSIYFISPGTD